MFTIQQIHEAHSKVKSGADFPKYMQDIIAFGVTSFETFVFDNHTHYYGANDFQIASEGFSEPIAITRKNIVEKFKDGCEEIILLISRYFNDNKLMREKL